MGEVNEIANRVGLVYRHKKFLALATSRQNFFTSFSTCTYIGRIYKNELFMDVLDAQILF